jgi:hypothetical protein
VDRALDEGALMAEIPNPWMTLNSEAAHSHAADLIAARTDVLQTVGTTVSARDEPDATNHINEIFWFVRNKLAPRQDFVDLDALEAAIDPLPLFLRKAG